MSTHLQEQEQEQERADPTLDRIRAAALLHEITLTATADHEVLTAVAIHHRPETPPVAGDLFGPAHVGDAPVCGGCDRAAYTQARRPPWPCSTYTLIVRSTLSADAVAAALGSEATAALHPPEGRGAPPRGQRVTARHLSTVRAEKTS
jgi:hypothetical protein